MKKLPAERVELLNTGHVESRNLMEFLVLDPELILKNNFPDFNYIKPASGIGIVQKLEYIATNLNEQFGFKKFEQFSSHKSDLIRSLACYLLAKQPFSFEDRINDKASGRSKFRRKRMGMACYKERVCAGFNQKYSLSCSFYQSICKSKTFCL